MERSRTVRRAGEKLYRSSWQAFNRFRLIARPRSNPLESASILEARGLPIGPMDLLIAGTAVSRGAVLATNNTKEFSRIKGLRLSDWTR
jgi:tRNA(fMet)-specific endonuclease VapC